jgi:ABC-type microcin C transport system permease subunit YejE
MQRDKLKHLLAGIGISLVFGVQFTPFIGLIIAVIVGALKEIIWDWLLKRGTPEFLDFLATVLGGAIAYMVVKFVLGG